MINLSDEELVKNFLDGDEKCFALLVKRHGSSLYNFILRLCGNREEAQDIVQDVFLKIFKSLNKFDTEKSFKTWIFSIARNSVVDFLRKKKQVAFSSLDPEEGDTFSDGLEDLAPLPDEIFERKELGQDLERALLALSEDKRALVILHHTEGLTFQEIADITGVSINTLTSQHRRILLELRTRITSH